MKKSYEIKKEDGRGGARPGAGRKRMGDELKARSTISIDKNVLSKAKASAKEKGETVSQLIERLLRDWLRR